MSRPRYQLTQAIEQAILAYVRAGGFPHVAAEAAGVPRDVFERWLERGQGPRATARLRAFREAVLQAQAQARLGAEVSALKDKPMDWLRSGPGRETPETTGWTATVKPHGAAKGVPAPLLEPAVQNLLRLLLDLLAPYPDARAALARALAEQGLAAERPGKRG